MPTSIPPTMWAMALISGDFNVEEDLASAREKRKAVPDMQNAVNHLLAEGDLVLVHWTLSGTNTQAGMGTSWDRQTDQDFRDDPVPLQGRKDL